MNNTATVYLDKNILDFHISKKLRLKKTEVFDWVYSWVHFKEFEKSEQCNDLLNALDEIGASYLELYHDGVGAKVSKNQSSFIFFSEFQEYSNQLNTINSLNDPLAVWLNGGKCLDEVISIPKVIKKVLFKNIEELSSGLSEDELDMCCNGSYKELMDQFDNVYFKELESKIKYLESINNHHTLLRKEIHTNKGEIGNIIGSGTVQRIWDQIKHAFPGVMIDDVFSHPLGKNKLSYYQSVINCCIVFDLIGYKAESKSRKISKYDNVKSDYEHLAMSAFCNIFVTHDNALDCRAKAIFDYLEVDTVALHLNDIKGVII